MEDPSTARPRRGGLLSSLAAVALLVAASAAATSGDSTRGAMDDDHARVRWWQRGLAAEGAGGGHGPMNVFAMALSGMDQVEIGWMMVAVIFSQLILDEVLRRVEASVGSNARACLREVYKELSTLGLISFTLFLVQSFESKVDEDTLQAFEYSHIFVFSFAIMYVVQSAVLIASILPIQRRFVRLHAYGDAVAAAIGELPPPPLAQPQPSSPPGCYASLWAWFGGGGDQSVVVGGGGGGRGAGKGAVRAFDGFRAFRRRFLSKHALPASFLFDRYLIEVYDRWVIIKLDVASWCWALMCLIFGIHALVGATSPEFAAFCLDRWTFLGFGWLILLADCTLFHLVHRIHARVLKGVRASDRNSSSMLNISSLGLSCSISTTGPRRGPGGLKRNQRDSQHEREEEEVEEDDALETLRRRRAALHARRYQEQQHARQQYQKQQQLQGRRSSPKNMIGVVDPALAATMGSSTGGGIGNNHHNADAGVLRHPPRHWSLGGVLSSPIMLSAQPPPPLSQSGPTTADEGGGDAVGLGFTPREAFFFNYGTEALNIVRCLYLAAWLCTYAVPAFLNGWFPSVGWALFYILVIPIPAIITGTALIPRMVTRFLLVASLSQIDLEAFDAVVEYMEEAEAALKEIALLLRALAAEEANDTSCIKNSSGSKACSDGVERLVAALAQHHHTFTTPTSSKPRARNKTATAAVAPAPFEPPGKAQPAPPTSISYAQLRDFLRHHGVHMPLRRFRALVRFIDTDLCGRIDVEDFKALLEADHLFCAHPQHTHPAAGRVARLLSQQLSRQLSRSVSQSQQQRRGSVVLVNVADLLRRGSSVLVDRWDGEVGDGDGGQEDV